MIYNLWFIYTALWKELFFFTFIFYFIFFWFIISPIKLYIIYLLFLLIWV